MKKTKRGRPLIGQNKKTEVVQKLEPYLNIGLSIRKACLEAKVSRAWVYTLMTRDGNFADQITRCQNFLSVLVLGAIFNELMSIVAKQQRGEELSSTDLSFLMWYVTHAVCCREEFGRDDYIAPPDPELEILKLHEWIEEEIKNQSHADSGKILEEVRNGNIQSLADFPSHEQGASINASF